MLENQNLGIVLLLVANKWTNRNMWSSRMQSLMRQPEYPGQVTFRSPSDQQFQADRELIELPTHPHCLVFYKLM